MSALLQWIHVTAAVIGVGAMAFVLLILHPSLVRMQPEQRDLVAQQIRGRFRWVIWSAILVLLASGLYIIRQFYWEVAWGKSWILLTVKIASSLIVFLIALALTLPFTFLDRVRARQQFWLSIGVGLAIAVIFISAYLRR